MIGELIEIVNYCIDKTEIGAFNASKAAAIFLLDGQSLQCSLLIRYGLYWSRYQTRPGEPSMCLEGNTARL